MCGALEYAIWGLMYLLIASSSPTSPCPYPCKLLGDPIVVQLIKDLDDFDRALKNTPPKLSKKVKQVVADVKRAAWDLGRYLEKDLSHPCENDQCVGDARKNKRRDYPWNRCEAKAAGLGECEMEGQELMACSRVSQQNLKHMICVCC